MGLDTVELVMDVEEKFDIEISDRDASKIETVGQLYDTVLAKLTEKHASVDREQVWEQLRMIFVDEFGLRTAQVVPEARITKDLGLD